MASSLATVKNEPIDINEESARKASQMPKPKGYKILIALPEPDEKTDGGIISRQARFVKRVIGL